MRLLVLTLFSVFTPIHTFHLNFCIWVGIIVHCILREWNIMLLVICWNVFRCPKCAQKKVCTPSGVQNATQAKHLHRHSKTHIECPPWTDSRTVNNWISLSQFLVKLFCQLTLGIKWVKTVFDIFSNIQNTADSRIGYISWIYTRIKSSIVY